MRVSHFVDAALYTGATPHVLRPITTNNHNNDTTINTDDDDANDNTNNIIASLLVSNCNPRSPRNALIAELLLWLPIASAGRCFSSSTQRPIDTAAVDKMAFLARYPFHVAIENAFEEDYVTEKFFDCFRAGVVCIYMVGMCTRVMDWIF